MTKKLLPSSTLALAGAVSLGVIGLTSATAAANDTDGYAKREDTSTELVTVTDDDDDGDDLDTGTNTATNTATGTGSDASTSDQTSSGVTAVSRDRDLSRGDKTKDRTMDGGDPTRDLTPNLTNDRSRNDTRGAR